MPVRPTTPVAESIGNGSIIVAWGRWAIVDEMSEAGSITLRFEDDDHNIPVLMCAIGIPFADMV